LVMLAMCVNIYSSLKRRDLASALFGPNGVAGLLFYACMILVVLSLVIKMPVPTYVFGIIMAVAIILIFLREPLAEIIKGEKHWQPESWAEYSLDNGAELFEVVLSYFSNTLSFLRVGAFVLIHAGMMLMFFKLAEYMPNAALYTLLIVFGNIFVIVLEGLLVGIQVLRLEFYEMFSRFYFGDGRDWTPVSVKNKD
ncbi:MAG: ATPase, partial [Clostridia bacterium]|nr:ATPase [Clostridia bacterium]